MRGMMLKIFFDMNFDLAHQYGFSSLTTSFSQGTSEALAALKRLNSKIGGQEGGEAGRAGGGEDDQIAED